VIGCVVLALAQAASPAAEPETQIVYTRAEVVAAVSGETRVRRGYSKRLALPDPDCEEGAFSCTEDRIYGQVYSLEFSEEFTARRSDGSTSTERTARGRLTVTLDLSPDDEELLEESLVTHLEGLSAFAYADRQAGMRFGRGPLSQRTLERSSLPVWVCREFDDEYSFNVLISVDESVLRTHARAGEVAEHACRAIEEAAAGTSAEIVRTTPSIREQIRQRVRLQSVSTLGGLSWADNLAPLPDGVTFEKRALDHEKTGAIRDRQGDVFRGHEGRFDDVERHLGLPVDA